jgi:hypothetical protein
MSSFRDITQWFDSQQMAITYAQANDHRRALMFLNPCIRCGVCCFAGNACNARTPNKNTGICEHLSFDNEGLSVCDFFHKNIDKIDKTTLEEAIPMYGVCLMRALEKNVPAFKKRRKEHLETIKLYKTLR